MTPEDRLLLSPPQGYDKYFDWHRLRDQVLVPLPASGWTGHISDMTG